MFYNFFMDFLSKEGYIGGVFVKGGISMKDPMTYVERFCYKHPRFGIPNLMRYIAIGSAAMWLLGLFNAETYAFFVFSPRLVLQGEVWRLLTFFFVPDNMNWLGLFTIFLYYWIGNTLEAHWGTGQFTIYFFSGAILSMLYGIVAYLLFRVDFFLTPTFVYLAMFFAFAVYFPDLELLVFFILPIKIKYLAWLNAAFFVYGILTASFPENLLPVVAMLNFCVFCGGELLRMLRGRKTTKQAVNFRREARRIRYEQAQKLYNHKCAVCGRTDTDHPELEFRYCSRCAGYHCFCQDHINNHIHFTE